MTRLRSSYPLITATAFLLLALLFAWQLPRLIPSANTLGRTLYVRSDALPASTTCALASPCREVSQALAIAIAGDTIEVTPGTYKPFRVIGKNGITIRGTADNVIIVADRTLFSGAIAVRIDRSENITLDRLTLTGGKTANGTSGRGAFITLSHDIIVKNSFITDNEVTGITTGNSHGSIFENNTFQNSRSHGLYVSNSSDNVIIRGNTFKNPGSSALQVNAADNGQAGEDGISTNILIEKNQISLSDQGMNLLGVQDSTVRNNLIFNNQGSGIALARDNDVCSRAPQGPKNVRVLNNTVVMGPGAWYPIHIKESVGPVILRNNIVFSQDTNRGLLDIYQGRHACGSLNATDESNTDSNYNIFVGTPRISYKDESFFKTFAEWQSLGKDTNSLTSNYASVFGTRTDYRLPVTSVALNKGATVQVADDIDGDARPQGTAYDIGADELAVVSPSPSPSPSSSLISIEKSVTPNVVRAGDIVTITLHYTNTTLTPVANYTLSDTLPSGFSYVVNSATQSGTFSGNQINWAIAGPLGVGNTEQVSYQVRKN